MSKGAFTLVSIMFWLVAVVMVALNHDLISERFGSEEGTSLAAAYVVIVVAFLAGILVNTMMADSLFAPSVLEGGLDDMSKEERHRVVEKQASEALNSGNIKLAIVAYENGGMADKALALAQKHGEHAIVARISMKLGKHDSARRAAIAAGDHLMAGHLSLLLKDFREAKIQYGLYTEKAGVTLKPAEKARYLDRAGRYQEAAGLYSEYGDFVRAADAWMLAGNPDQAGIAREKASVLEAVEKGRDAMSSANQRNRLVREGDMARDTGDLFGAAWAYREAGNGKTAGEVFESIEEWVRAATCYELAGEQAKAQQMWEKASRNPPPAPPLSSDPRSTNSGIGPPSYVNNPMLSGGNSGAFPTAGIAPSGFSPNQAFRSAPMPMPGGAPMMTAPPPFFSAPSALPAPLPWVPVYRLPPQMQMPIYVPPSYVQAMKGMMPPKDQAGWKQLAESLAISGNLKEAADVHLQRGDYVEAVTCLADAGRRQEAAMLALGGGNYAKAAELLVDQIDGGAREGVGELLGQLLINLGEFELAEQLLRKRLAPKINQETAGLVFQFARMFEEAGALEPALGLYEDLIRSGAKSPQLEVCIRSVQRRLSSDDGSGSRSGSHSPLLTSQVRRKLTPQDLLNAAADQEAIGGIHAEPTLREVPEAMPTYEFVPPKGADAIESINGVDRPTLPKPKRQVSLLGSMAVQDEEAQRKGFADPFQLKERYRIDKEIGRGGMGTVYKAHDVVLDRTVALKLLHSFGSNQEALQHFLMEARAVARLNSQHVVRIFDMGVMDLKHYIAMEYVTGGDLRTAIGTMKRMPLKDALRVFVQIAEGLGAAHEAGIVHRDIKPGNVLLTDYGDVRLVDFGLAQLDNAAGQTPEIVASLRTAGTPGFMAPEQIRGETVGPPADIYALGITLFHMLVGMPPFRVAKLSAVEDVVQYTLEGKLPTMGDFVPGLPPAIEHLYRYCTATAVGDRFREVNAFLPTARQWLSAL